jgi:hypothetical protein
MDPSSGDEAVRLTVLASVRCLACSAVYGKPTNGGTALQNPGCPDCGYMGWAHAAAGSALTHWAMPPRSAAGPLQHLPG